MDSKGTTFVILINRQNFDKSSECAPIRKERLSPTSKARREASRNELMEESGMPDRIESFRQINGKEDRWKVGPGFVKPILRWTEKGKEFDRE